jgi:hypothetical protein
MVTPEFLVDTVEIPDGVDQEIAERRNALVEQWRTGEIDADTALGGVAKIYWENMTTASEDTRFWLVDTLSHFAIDANMEARHAHDIWTKQQDEE